MDRRAVGEVVRGVAVLAIICVGGVFGYGSWVLLFLNADDVCEMGVDAGERFALSFVGLGWMCVCLVVAGIAGSLLIFGESRRARLIGIGVVAMLVVCTGLLQWWNVASFTASCGTS